jgi:hypothetical protein
MKTLNKILEENLMPSQLASRLYRGNVDGQWDHNAWQSFIDRSKGFDAKHFLWRKDYVVDTFDQSTAESTLREISTICLLHYLSRSDVPAKNRIESNAVFSRGVQNDGTRNLFDVTVVSDLTDFCPLEEVSEVSRDIWFDDLPNLIEELGTIVAKGYANQAVQLLNQYEDGIQKDSETVTISPLYDHIKMGESVLRGMGYSIKNMLANDDTKQTVGQYLSEYEARLGGVAEEDLRKLINDDMSLPEDAAYLAEIVSILYLERNFFGHDPHHILEQAVGEEGKDKFINLILDAMGEYDEIQPYFITPRQNRGNKNVNSSDSLQP